MLMTETMPDNKFKSLSNPIIWVGLIVFVLVVALLFFSDRGDNGSLRLEVSSNAEQGLISPDLISQGEIDRSLLPTPGAMARELISNARLKGKPYNLAALHTQAGLFYVQGNLADAHILFFFCARESYKPAMLKMAEMADPLRFNTADSLLDKADSNQARKWYQLAADAGSELAKRRLQDLYLWAVAEADRGNLEARNLLLNYRP